MEGDGSRSLSPGAAETLLDGDPACSQACPPGNSLWPASQAGQLASCQLARSPCCQFREFPHRCGGNAELSERATAPAPGGGEAETRAPSCDSCLNADVQAVRLCLKCDMAFCEEHLQPHLLNPRLRAHPLVPSGESAEERQCPTHREQLRFYCRDHACPICPLCVVAGDHKSHEISTLQDEHVEKKELILKGASTNQAKLENAVDFIRGLEAIRVTVEENAVQVKRELSTTIAGMKALLDEDEQDAVRHVDTVVNSLLAQIQESILYHNMRIATLTETNKRLQALMEEKDSLKFLKTFKLEKEKADATKEQPRPKQLDLGKISSLHWIENVLRTTKILKNESPVTQLVVHETLLETGGGMEEECSPLQSQESAATVATATTAAKVATAKKPRKKKSEPKSGASPQPGPGVTACNTETLSAPAPPLEVPAVSKVAAAAATAMESTLSQTALVGFSPTINPNSAHPRLVLSHNLKTATRSKKRQGYPDHVERFEGCVQALCQERLSAGRHYWEVGIGVEEFCVGIAYGTISRKGLEANSGLGRNKHSWCLQGLTTGYSALHEGKRFPVKVRQPLSKLGVYLDYKNGMLAFYDLNSMMLLYIFYTSFTDSVYPALWVGNGSITMI